MTCNTEHNSSIKVLFVIVVLHIPIHFNYVGKSGLCVIHIFSICVSEKKKNNNMKMSKQTFFSFFGRTIPFWNRFCCPSLSLSVHMCVCVCVCVAAGVLRG